jgi:hypothetical protein
MKQRSSVPDEKIKIDNYWWWKLKPGKNWMF